MNKNEGFAYLDKLIECYDFLAKTTEDGVCCASTSSGNDIHIWNIKTLAEIIGFPIVRMPKNMILYKNQYGIRFDPDERYDTLYFEYKDKVLFGLDKRK